MLLLLPQSDTEFNLRGVGRTGPMESKLRLLGALGSLVLFGTALAVGWDDSPKLLVIPAFVALLVGTVSSFYFNRRQRHP